MSTVTSIVPLVVMTCLAYPEQALAGSWCYQVGSGRKSNRNLFIVQ